MIQLSNISLAFGERTLIEGASTHFECGEMVALLGRNGTGKSTLLRAIAKLGEVAKGDIIIDGKAISDIDIRTFARLVAFVNTERVDIDSLSAYDLVAIGRSPYTDWMGRLTKRDRDIIERSMQITGVDKLADRMVETLSDGECQRVMIARAIAQQTPIILLDEPTAFLDIPTRFEVCRLLADLAHKQGKCILFSTHDVDSALPVCDSFAIIENETLRKIATSDAATEIDRIFKR